LSNNNETCYRIILQKFLQLNTECPSSGLPSSREASCLLNPHPFNGAARMHTYPVPWWHKSYPLACSRQCGPSFLQLPYDKLLQLSSQREFFRIPAATASNIIRHTHNNSSPQVYLLRPEKNAIIMVLYLKFDQLSIPIYIYNTKEAKFLAIIFFVHQLISSGFTLRSFDCDSVSRSFLSNLCPL
jgi:hypothetical protein